MFGGRSLKAEPAAVFDSRVAAAPAVFDRCVQQYGLWVILGVYELEAAV